METVRERFRDWRKGNGYTLKEVASAVGQQLGRDVSESSISNFESRADPNTAVIQALGMAFPELSLRWLLTGEPEAYGLIEEQPRDYYIPEALDTEVRRIADEVVSLPFEHPDHFLTPEEMTEAECLAAGGTYLGDNTMGDPIGCADEDPDGDGLYGACDNCPETGSRISTFADHGGHRR